MPTREYLHDVHGLLKSLTQEVDSAVAAGATLDETQRTVTLTGWRNRFGMNDQARETTFDQFFLAPAVERAWHQAKGDEEGL